MANLKRFGPWGFLPLLSVGALLFSCSSYVYEDDTKDYTFTNPTPFLPTVDAGIDIDGDLSDPAYSNTRYLVNKYSNANEEVTVKMGTHFGAEGVYFLFDVDDPAVFVNPDRSGSWNSGIELYLAPEDSTDIEGEGWEIDFTPGLDLVTTRLRRGGLFSPMLQAKEDTPFMRSKGKNGQVGEAGATGYTIEAFFPYGFFGEGKIDSLELCPTLLRTYNDEENVRLWYNFGQECKTGYSFSNPSTWWSFDGNGMEAHLLSFVDDGHGRIESDRNYAEDGDSVEISLVPNAGYRLLSISSGETDYTSQTYVEDGKLKVTIPSITSDLEVKASFVELSQTTHEISGQVNYFGEAVPTDRIAELGLSACCGGAFYDIAIQSDGTYSASLPEGTYFLILSRVGAGTLVSAQGNLAADSTFDLNIESTLDASIFLGKPDFTKDFASVTGQTNGMIYDNKDNGSLYPDHSVIESSFYAPKIKEINADNIKFGFRVYLKNAMGTGDFSVADVAIGKTGDSWYLDAGYDLASNAIRAYKLSDYQLDLVSKGEFTVLLVKEGATHRLYAETPDGFESAAVYVDDDPSLVSFSTIDLLALHTTAPNAIGEFGMKGTKVYCQYAEGIGEGDGPLVKALTNKAIHLRPSVDCPLATISGLAKSYQPGETIVFALTPDRLSEITSVTINGTPVSPQNGQYSYQLPASANEIAIKVVSSAQAVIHPGHDLSKDFASVPNGVTSHGVVYNYDTDAASTFADPSLIEARFLAPEIEDITENGVRFGMRLYSKQVDDLSNTGFIDVVVANENDKWYLDIGLDLVNDKLKPETNYELTAEQVASIAGEGLKVYLSHEGNEYRLYAEKSAGEFQFVESYLDSDLKRTSYATIDLITNPVTAASRGKGSFAIKGFNVYSEFDQSLSDSALLHLVEESQVAVYYPVRIDSQVATINGLDEDGYAPGEEIHFTLTPNRFATITEVKIGDTVLTQGEDGYRYSVPSSNEGPIELSVAGTASMNVYAGLGDIRKSFAEVTASPSTNMGQNNVQGSLYSCGSHANYLPSPMIVEAKLGLDGLDSILENGTRMGLRMYNREEGSTSNTYLYDAIVARQGGVWVLDMAPAASIDNQYTPSTAYQLSEGQMSALKAGTLSVYIVNDGQAYSLYAFDGESLELVKTLTASTGSSLSALDCVVNTGATALRRSKGNFAIAGLTAYADFDPSLTPEQAIQHIIDNQ